MTIGARRRIAAVVRLELLIHRREPLTALYVLVFVLLGAAFTAAGPVELVRNRGDVPRHAAWSVMLASTALTAFGQVITTMVAATIVLRDQADRVIELVTVSHLTSREYLIGKLLAALLILGLIYCAVPVGLMIGAVIGGGGVIPAALAVVPPFVLIVLPTMLTIGTLQFGVGVLSGRLWVIVGLGLLLIWLWSAAVGAVGGAADGVLVALADPFGSAPVLQATRDWSDAQRASNGMPITGALLANRAVWLAAGLLVAGLAIVGGARVPARSGVAPSLAGEAPGEGYATAPIARSHPAAPLQGAIATATYVARWMLRDTGWRVLAGLGAVNVGVHALLDARGSVSSADTTTRALNAMVTHSRLFLILLATIYAGELVWREREERSAPLFDAQPISDDALIFGRVCGVVITQGVLVLLLVVAAAVAAMLGAHDAVDVSTLASGAVMQLAVPFVVWSLVSLAVHVTVQQKVVAHLLLIASWVLAVLLVGTGLDDATPRRWTPLAWAVAAAVALAVVRLRWFRGLRPRGSSAGHPSTWLRK